MRSSRRTAVGVGALILLAIVARVPAQTRPSETLPPSASELQRMFDAGQYQDVVRHVVRVLSLKGEAAAQYDRHELFVLKAESHVRLGDAEPAARAFEDAAGVARDEAAVALDRATALLARRAKQGVYRPRTASPEVGAGEPLSVIDPVGRKLALRALYADERAAAQRLLGVPARASLADLLAAMDAAAPLRALELGATGATGQTDAVLGPLCDRARTFMGDELDEMSARVDKLDKAANKKKKMGSAYRKRGLSAEEQAELRDVARRCEKLGPAAQRFADAAPADADGFTAIRADSQALYDHATKVLTADYTTTYDRD